MLVVLVLRVLVPLPLPPMAGAGAGGGGGGGGGGGPGKAAGTPKWDFLKIGRLSGTQGTLEDDGALYKD